MNIIFCIPGRTFSDKFFNSWNKMLFRLNGMDINYTYVNKYSSNVYYARNLCLGGNNLAGIHQKPWQGQVDYDYMMWLDSDIVWEPQQFIRLLNIAEHYDDVNIISGLYSMENGYEFATVVDWDMEEFKRHGRFEFLNKDILKQYKKDELIKVAYTGFGFILIKRGVVESTEYPWFRPLWEEIDLPNGIRVKDYTSEDVGFCRTIIENGYDIYVDPTVIVGHEKSKVLY